LLALLETASGAINKASTQKKALEAVDERLAAALTKLNRGVGKLTSVSFGADVKELLKGVDKADDKTWLDTYYGMGQLRAYGTEAPLWALPRPFDEVLAEAFKTPKDFVAMKRP
jgi:hypothetical protein